MKGYLKVILIFLIYSSISILTYADCPHKMFPNGKGTEYDPYQIYNIEQIIHLSKSSSYECFENHFIQMVDLRLDPQRVMNEALDFTLNEQLRYLSYDGNNKKITWNYKVGSESSRGVYVPIPTKNSLWVEWPYTSNIKGNGVVSDPYVIDNNNLAIELFDRFGGGSNYYVQENDLYFLSETVFGVAGTEGVFSGYYDGKFNLLTGGANRPWEMPYVTVSGTIKNLKINGGELFSYVTKEGVLDKITRIAEGNTLVPHSNGNYTGGFDYGGIARDNLGLITNCVNYSNIHSAGMSHMYDGATAGGIVANNKGVIQNSANYGDIKASGSGGENRYKGLYSGGIAGVNTGIVRDSYNYGKVDAVCTRVDDYSYETKAYLGGIVGSNGHINQERDRATGGGEIVNCYNAKLSTPRFGKFYQITSVSASVRYMDRWGDITSEQIASIGDNYGFNGLGDMYPSTFYFYCEQRKGGGNSEVWTISSKSSNPIYKTDSEMQNVAFLNLLNSKSTQSIKPWIKGDPSYPYPTLIFGNLPISISTPYVEIGDNTSVQVSINTYRDDIIKITNLNNNSVVYEGNKQALIPVNIGSSQGDFRFKAELIINNQVVGISNIISVNKLNILDNLRTHTYPSNVTQVMILNDTDRFFEDNAANRELINYLKNNTNIFLIYNDLSEVLRPLLER